MVLKLELITLSGFLFLSLYVVGHEIYTYRGVHIYNFSNFRNRILLDSIVPENKQEEVEAGAVGNVIIQVLFLLSICASV
jgi:hypothetical protein